ncbi:septum formation family protein [Curtobacterium luteum]|uniref:Septum formation-related domain-containing protein n=1 Tax=Curtobacterium luteum TaxID=33881 RepID=A0A175RYG0_9MICO|nr:septum formation family protein [Curtobacterium luteum]KTR08348.1 hypothetical protein NS184_05815 [Curtobacterium luteum]
MTGERPDDARRPEDTAGPADGDDGLEARRASDTDAPFHGLRSAADIFGAPRSADEWPSRRERREAIKAAQETGAPLPEPFTAPAEDSSDAETTQADEGADTTPADEGADGTEDDAPTQAISMPEELRAPSQQAHPSSIQLPTAQTNRDARAAEARALDEERRRTDPTGTGRDDVDWLGRATGTGTGAVTVGEPMARQPIGVEDALPSADEPPSFTDLLRVQPGPDDGAPGPDRPFDWAVHDDETGEVPTTLTSEAYDTTAFDTTGLATGSWTLADEAEEEDEVVTGEVPTAGAGFPAAAGGVAAGAAAGAVASEALAAAPTETEPDAPTTRLSVPDAATGLPVEPTRPGTPTGPSPAEPAPAPAESAPAPAESGPARSAPTSWSLSDDAEETPTVAFEPPRSATATPWWSEPDDAVPPTAAPPLVEPTPESYPAHLPPAVGQDFDGLLSAPEDRPDPEPVATTAPAAGAVRPEDIDQSEWTDRETSDTSAIKDLFGTAAVDQLGTTGYDPHDTGTAMMPAVQSSATTGASAARTPGAPTPSPSQQGIINQQFAKLQGEGTRGKQLLIGGAVVLIVVLLVLVFLFARWIMGNTVADHLVPPTKSPTAAAQSASPSTTPSAPAAASDPAEAAPGLQFATTPAAPGEHAWTDLAGGECLSPFTNAWAQTFTVVDCAAPHAAQLTARLPVQADAYPGADALAAQAGEQCQTSTALDTAAAGSVGDVQVQGTYAPDESSWQQGDTFISCFVTRSSGQELTGSLAPTA